MLNERVCTKDEALNENQVLKRYSKMCEKFHSKIFKEG